ncbi:MAG TPA: AAA family ATPase [Ramlibacter sp.]|nr:AAA family ATPase [Ramlibacter sp.]
MQAGESDPPHAALDDRWVRTLARSLSAEVVETHISWVLLAGGFAYKVKKPLTLPFVDYGALSARRHFCEEEVRLNQRLAPSLYLGVSRITGSRDAPQLDGEGPVIDHAVRMRRFPAEALFSERLASGHLTPEHVDAIAERLAAFHRQAPVCSLGTAFATPAHRRSVALAALHGARTAATPEQHALLASWIDAQADAQAPLWQARRENGRIRECHGDLHLDNLVMLDDGPAAFDCIEFDPALRWIDVIDDIAFAVMDFCARGHSGLAWRLLNAWLDHSGDHAALPALRFAVVYRALVRAQVAQLRGTAAAEQALRYLDTAVTWTQPRPLRLCITHGLPGSGKTRASQRLLEREGAIRLRSDVERKRLFGLAPLADSRAAGLDLYNAATTARTYEHLFELARGILRAGYPVVIDAAFLRGDERARARTAAQEAGVPFAILDCDAPSEVLRARLLARRGDASEADEAVLERLRQAAEPLTAEERAHAFTGD